MRRAALVLAALGLWAGCARGPLLRTAPDAPPAAAEAPAPDFRALFYAATDELGVRYYLQDSDWALTLEGERDLRNAAAAIRAELARRPDDPELLGYLTRAEQLLGMKETVYETCRRLVNQVGFGSEGREALAAVMVYTTYANHHAAADRHVTALNLYQHAIGESDRIDQPREALYTLIRYLVHLDRLSTADAEYIDPFLMESERFLAREPGNFYAHLFAGKAYAKRYRRTGAQGDRAAAEKHLLLALDQFRLEDYPAYVEGLRRTLADVGGRPPAPSLAAAAPAPAAEPAAEAPKPVAPARLSGQKRIEETLSRIAARVNGDEGPAAAEVVIFGAAANLRGEPGRSAPVVGVARRGERFAYLERRGPWLRVKREEGGDAWVHATLARATPGAAMALRLESKPEPKTAPELPAGADGAQGAPEPAAALALRTKPPAAADARPEAPPTIPPPTPTEKILAARQRYRVDFLEAGYKTLAPPGGAKRRYLAVGAYVRNVNESERLPYLTVLCELTNQQVRLGEVRAHIRTDGVAPGEASFVVFYVPTDLGGLDGARIVIERAPPPAETAELGAPARPEAALQLTDANVRKAVLYLSARDSKTGRKLADDVNLWSSPEGGLGGADLRFRGRDGQRVRVMEKRASATDGRVYYRVQSFIGEEGWVWEGYTRLKP